MNSETGQAFRQAILEKGGSRDPMELFIEFRGREPRVDHFFDIMGWRHDQAFYRRSGLSAL